MLGKKQNITDNQQWLDAYKSATEIYSLEDIKRLESDTIEIIQRVTKDYKNISSGWIAGKDSLVLDNVLKNSGISYTPVMWCGVNEYPAMISWIEQNKPSNLIREIIDKFSLEYIEKHPDYLFCQNGTRQKWMSEKWRRYKRDIAKYDFDLFIVARRLKDGNICGSKENGYIVKKDFTTFAPLAEWDHEQLLAYIQYYNIKLPPFYEYPRGFLIGSVAMGEWTERPAMNMSINEVWEELYCIDKNIVINAAKTLTSAKIFLAERNSK